MLVAFTTGVLLGLAGSLHCVGMCGPLSLGLPVHHLSPQRKAGALGLYHAGRIFTYAMLGLLFGLAGRRLYLAGMQQTVSIVLGIVMVIFTVNYFWFRQSYQPAFIKKFHLGIQTRMIKLLNRSSLTNFFLFGSLNGLLPCGMVYVAVAAAMSTNDVLNGVMFMSGFGFATFPAMFAFGFFGYLLNITARNQFKKLTPYIICIIGLLLILRGMSLGIPFISPVMESAPAAAVDCH
ncbi:MAG TPA: sulfite exporter TauE/SafE family protein [Chitinophagaceae bacterium]